MRRKLAAMLAVVLMLGVSANPVVASEWNAETAAEVVSLPEDPEYFKYLENQDAGIMLMDLEETNAETNAETEVVYVHNSRFENATIRKGIDVSYYQNNAGTIDWNAVKESGVEFVIVRVGYRGYDKGVLQTDPRGQENLKAATEAGLKVGAYIFSQAITPEEAREEARFVVEQVKDFELELPIVMDFEYVSNGTGRLWNADLSNETATEIVNAFGAEARLLGYEPMIYANSSMLQYEMNAKDIPYKIWLAHYTTQSSYPGEYEFWQYTSKGSVPGITGNVDCNFWYDGMPAKYTQTIADGTYYIESAVGENRVVEIADSSEDNGANIQLGEKSDFNKSKFKITYVGNGQYSLMSWASGKYVDVANGGIDNGTNILQWEGNEAGNQRWFIQDAGEGFYYIKSATSEKCMDVVNASTEIGTNIQLWSANGTVGQKFKLTATKEAPTILNGWIKEGDTYYWYEDSVKQGTEGRGKEIYDESSDAWYWLDAPDGKKAVSKDVYQESEAGIWGDKLGEDGLRYGKWVRYDENGRMVKGWQTVSNGTYFFDYTYGTMAKGFATIGTKEYYFNTNTGVQEREIGEVPEFGWKNIDGIDYWYEGYVRQGYSVDEAYRGKEIYDPVSDAWYWLDNVDGGKKATNKDVYQESEAGVWGDYVGEDGLRYGKWVRYDENGHMIKGWNTNENGTYYFDPIYGTMAKGEAVIDGVTYYFNPNTGVLQ